MIGKSVQSATTITAAASAILALSFLGVDNSTAQATGSTPTPTRLVIRAVSHDAKIIGSGVGGARIVIQDAATGEVLAHGLQTGSTGSTTHIMVSPPHRDSVRYDTEGAAGFTAELSIDKPTIVDISAYGPLGTTGTAMNASKRMVVVPGQHVLGEGIILELNGFTVELIEATGVMGKLDLRARVTMLCGCPTEPGGMWDSDRIDVSASLMVGDRVVAVSRLAYAGKASTYSAVFDNMSSGVYDVQIVAADNERGNFGMTNGTVVVP